MVSNAKKSHAKAHGKKKSHQRSKQHRARQSGSTSSFTKYMRVYRKDGPRMSAYRKKKPKQMNTERLHRHIIAAYKAGGKINGKKVMHYVTKKGTSVYRRYKAAKKVPKKKRTSHKKKKKTSHKKKKKTSRKKKKQTSGRRRSTRNRKKPNRLGY